MKTAIRITAAFLLSLIIIICCAQAADSNIYYLTEELSRIKTQHDNGFINVEKIESGDPHFGWGLGKFYVQGYGDVILGSDDIPVFLTTDGNQIYLRFQLEQDINALNGRGDLRVNEDSNGRDDTLGVNGPGFGRGGLIIEKTDRDGRAETETYTSYLTAVSTEPEYATGPLSEGNYRVALDYELQSGSVLPGYNDYKIAFSFKIQNKTDFYATKASVTNGINQLYLQTGAIIAAILFVAAFIIYFIIRKARSGKHNEIDRIYDSAENRLRDDKPKRSRLSPRATKCLIISILLIIAILCITVVGPLLSKPTTYLGPIRYLTEKTSTAYALLLGSSGISIVITALPGDTGTPIAQKLADLAGYLVVVISIITAEKYFMTSIGFIASTIVIPLACLCMIICILWQHEYRRKLAEWAIRLFIFGICIALIIPLGCACGRAVDSIDKEAFDNALRTADQATEMVEAAQLSYDEKDESKIESSMNEITKGLGIFKWADEAFTTIVAAISRILITTIFVPVLMLIAFIWAIKILTKKDFREPAMRLSQRIATRTSAEIRGIGKTPSKSTDRRRHKDEE